MLNEILSDSESKFETAIEYLKNELAVIRSSQTSPSLVEDIVVNAYDGQFPLKELAAISVPEPNVLLIQPWDQSITSAVETSIINSNLGISPRVEGTNIRINVPALSQERREEFSKKVKQLAEDTKVAIRNIRMDKMKTIDSLEEEGKISEDERDRARKDVQELVDTYNKQVDTLKNNKIESLMSI